MALQSGGQPENGNGEKPGSGQPDNTDAAFDAAFAEFNQPASGADTLSSNTDGAGASATDKAGGSDAATDAAAASDSTAKSKTQPSDKDAGSDAAAATKAAAAKLDWNNVPPEYRSAFEHTEAERTRLEQSDRSQRGRVSSLQRQLAQPRTPPPDPKGADGAARPAAAKVDPAKLKQIREDFPEMAPVVDGYEALAQATDHLAQEGAERQKLDRAAYIRANEDELAARIPNWHDLLFTEESGKAFAAWVKDQPSYVQDLALKRNGNAIEDVDAAEDVLRRFLASDAGKKFERPAQNDQGQEGQGGSAPNNQAARRKRQLEGSEAVDSRGGANGAGPGNDFDTAFDYYANRQTSQNQRGGRR